MNRPAAILLIGLLVGSLAVGCRSAAPLPAPSRPSEVRSAAPSRPPDVATETLPMEPPPTAARTEKPNSPKHQADSLDLLDYQNNVYFPPGSAMIDSREVETLDRHADRLKDDREMIVTLVGHTDHLGSRTYNLAISEKRVDAVASALQSRGVWRRQIRRIALGSEKGHGTKCRTDDCRQSMRRVELTYDSQETR